MKIIRGLYVIIQPGMHPDYSPLELAEFALQGGANVIQWRDKTDDPRANYQTVINMAELCRLHDVPFIINDRTDIAFAVNADGVHLGQQDLSIAAARELLGASKIIGASAGTIDAAQQCEQAGANYIGAGHVFPTQTKQKTTPPIGVDGLQQICQAVSLPVIAIGGITADNILDVLTAEPAGVAVVSAIGAAQAPEMVTCELAEKLESAARLG